MKPSIFLSEDGTGIWKTEWANSLHDNDSYGVTKKKDIFNSYAQRSLRELKIKMEQAGIYSPQVLRDASMRAMRAAEKFVKENPNCRSLGPFPAFQKEIDAAWEEHTRKQR